MISSSPVRRFWLAAAALAAVCAFTGREWLIAWRTARADFAGHTADATAPRCASARSPDPITFGVAGSGALHGWYSASRNGATVIVLHGSGSTAASMVAEMCLLAGAGFGVLAYDSPGFGESPGHVRWADDEQAAFHRAVAWIEARDPMRPEAIGALGFSMGAYVLTCAVGREPRVGAVVLIASPDDLQRQILHESGSFPVLKWPAAYLASRYLRGLPADNRQPIDCISDISPRPLLMIRGVNDRVVPEAATTALYARARAPKDLWRVPSAGHGGYLEAAPHAYPEHLIGFFDRALRAAPGPRTSEPAHGGRSP